MGLDITVMERKDVRCPHCGEVITTVDVASTDSGGSALVRLSGKARLLCSLREAN